MLWPVVYLVIIDLFVDVMDAARCFCTRRRMHAAVDTVHSWDVYTVPVTVLGQDDHIVFRYFCLLQCDHAITAVQNAVNKTSTVSTALTPK